MAAISSEARDNSGHSLAADTDCSSSGCHQEHFDEHANTKVQHLVNNHGDGIDTRPKNPSTTRGFTCAICDKFHHSGHLMVRHSNAGTEISNVKAIQSKDGCDVLNSSGVERTYDCQTCDAVFSDRTGLEMHSCKPNNIVEGDGNVVDEYPNSDMNPCAVCDVCGGVFGGDNNSLLEHECKPILQPIDVAFSTTDALEVQSAFIYSNSFDCDVCGNMFCDKESLLEHTCKPIDETFNMTDTSATNSSLSYDCDVCGESFGDSHNLEVHQCQTLLMDTAYDQQMKHIETNDESDDAFGRLSAAKRHRKLHSGIRAHICEQCGKSYASTASLSNHMDTHSLVRANTCDVCGKAFVGRNNLKKHKQRGTCKPPGVSDQDQCSSTSQLLSPLDTESNQTTYACDICGRTHRNKDGLEMHKLCHSRERSYICSVCGAGFFTKHTLLQHEALHSEERPFVCKTCRKAFRNRNALKSHERTHSNERPYLCNICRKTFRQQNHLVSHIRIHTGERPFQCHLCGKGFIKKCHLEVHQKIHTRAVIKQEDGEVSTFVGQPPYACEVCGKTFAYRSSLVPHMRIHSGERPFVCQICGRSFTQKANLRSHENYHAGVRPYECGTCGKTFSSSCNLSKHVRAATITTGDGVQVLTCSRPYQCVVCSKSFRTKNSLEAHSRSHNAQRDARKDIESN